MMNRLLMNMKTFTKYKKWRYPQKRPNGVWSGVKSGVWIEECFGWTNISSKSSSTASIGAFNETECKTLDKMIY